MLVVVMVVTYGQTSMTVSSRRSSGFESDWSAAETYHVFLYDAFLKPLLCCLCNFGAPCNFSRTPPSICDEEW